MSLHDAASLDESDKLMAKDVEVAAEARDTYLSPVFKVHTYTRILALTC